MDTALYEETVERYQRLVYTVCHQLTHNHHTAQDLAQDTMLSAWLHWDSCPADNPKAWLARIAANKAKDYLKSAWNRRVTAPGDDAFPETATCLQAAACQPEEAALQSETRHAIGDGIRGLGGPYTQVATLYYIEGYAAAEIADALDRPQKTVQTQLFRAKNKLRVALQTAAC